MTVRSRALVACLAASAVLLVATSGASADRFRVSSEYFTTIFSELRIVSGVIETITCTLTLQGSFHSRTITKTVGSLVGQVTHANLGICSGLGDARVVVLTGTLPWHVRYESFYGTLPNITFINFLALGMSFSWADWFTCLYRTSAEDPQGFTLVRQPRGEVNHVVLPTDLTTIDGTGWVSCPPISFAGSGATTTGWGETLFASLTD